MLFYLEGTTPICKICENCESFIFRAPYQLNNSWVLSLFICWPKAESWSSIISRIVLQSCCDALQKSSCHPQKKSETPYDQLYIERHHGVTRNHLLAVLENVSLLHIIKTNKGIGIPLVGSSIGGKMTMGRTINHNRNRTNTWAYEGDPPISNPISPSIFLERPILLCRMLYSCQVLKP